MTSTLALSTQATAFCQPSQFIEASQSDRNNALVEVLHYWLEQINIEPEQLFDKHNLDLVLIKIDEYLSQAVDTILHHPDFQALESLWQGLAYLCQHSDKSANCEVNILDVTKQELADDFEESPMPHHSFLYQQVYESEYDTPGGKPYSVMVSPYSFTASHQDVHLLSDISKVAASAHCPFLGNIDANFFHKENLEEVLEIQDLDTIMEKADYIAWNALRDTEDSRYLGLFVSRFLQRLPYGEQSECREFQYQESVEKHNDCLWGSGVFAFAANMAKSFKQYGWTVQVRGPQSGGMVSELPLYFYDHGGVSELQVPIEVILSETQELQLSNLGFIPLSYYKGSNQACFFSAQSLQRPKKYRDQTATANSIVNARLPYILLASRLGHNIKVLQRENIGAAKDQQVLERELNQWLQGLVTRMSEPSPQLIAQCPLKAAQVIVEPLLENPGYYKVNLMAIPHFQVEGMEVRLTLVSKMPKTER